MIAGGPKVKTAKDILQMTHDSLEAGGKGLSIGRNVFQHENPTQMIIALSSIVHHSASVEQATSIIGELS
jgi:class I fructose-bisphosphate aldolase